MTDTQDPVVEYPRERTARRWRMAVVVSIVIAVTGGMFWLTSRPSKAEIQDRKAREFSLELQRQTDCLIYHDC